MFQILNSKFQDKNGFTLLEVLIAISILVIMISIAVTVGRSFSDSVNLDNSAKMVEANIKLAKTRSVNALNDTNYGIHFEDNYIVIYDAENIFTEGDLTNEVIDLPDGIKTQSVSFAGGGDLIFNRLTGVTDNFGSLEVALIKDSSKKRQIVINKEGQVNYTSFQTSVAAPITNARHVHYDLTWNIEDSTILRLEWTVGSDTVINDIDMASYFNSDKSVFDWYGTTEVDGSDQTLRVHGWLDGFNETMLCVIRDQTEDNILDIYFIDGGTPKLTTTYTANADGTVSVTPNTIYVEETIIK